MGTLTITRFNGVEKFRLSESKAYCTYKHEEDGSKRIMMWFEAETDEEPMMTVPDTEGLHMNPSAEITIYLDELDLNHFGVRRYEIEAGYDHEQDNWDARLYYFEHQDVDRNVLMLEYKGQGVFGLQWKGSTTDICYYDGSKPDAILEVEGEFLLEEYEQW